MEPDPSLARLRFDRFELDEADARLTCAGEPVPLAPRPFEVLCTLARSPRCGFSCQVAPRPRGPRATRWAR